MTGYLRNGYCEVPASDGGNHSIAAEVSDEFLKFSAERGNDLRQIGLKGGCKWCLCVTRWKEAFDARGKEGDKIVPKYAETSPSGSGVYANSKQDLPQRYKRESTGQGIAG
jgi:hypothetical protein